MTVRTSETAASAHRNAVGARRYGMLSRFRHRAQVVLLICTITALRLKYQIGSRRPAEMAGRLKGIVNRTNWVKLRSPIG